MSSFRQIEANRRNARLSTGPITEDGKRRSRQNALRHGLTAETVITTLENAEDYAAFEMAVTADYDAQTAVERELVLRLASLLWRLRRASAIEAALRGPSPAAPAVTATETSSPRASRHHRQLATKCRYGGRRDTTGPKGVLCGLETGSQLTVGPADQSDDLTRAFVRLTDLPNYPLDRLSRYEATLWRQACQILFTLQCLDRRKPWQRLKLRDAHPVSLRAAGAHSDWRFVC